MGAATAQLERPLYIFVKPPTVRLSELARLRARLRIESNYSLDRLHSTFLPLGESSPTLIGMINTSLRDFYAAPFPITFDRIEGNALQPVKGQRAPGVLQRAIVRHLTVAGFSLDPYKFELHLNLDYAGKSDRRAAIPPLSWCVEEILLIESVNGAGRHIEHGHRRLIPRQRTFDFTV